jgi:hypothetical protein
LHFDQVENLPNYFPGPKQNPRWLGCHKVLFQVTFETTLGSYLVPTWLLK